MPQTTKSKHKMAALPLPQATKRKQFGGRSMTPSSKLNAGNVIIIL
jgi:hypothetical protein